MSATGATIKSGSTPVVFNWDYLNLPSYVGVSNWKVFVPSNAVLGGYYAQAINKNAPHPAAARLWEEFLFSQAAHDGGQNLWLQGGARPVEQTAMTSNKSIDAADAIETAPGFRYAGIPDPEAEHRRRQLPGGELGQGRRLARRVSVAATTPTGARPARAGRRVAVPGWVGIVPFLAYVGVFLLLPTGIVIFDAFKTPTGRLTLSGIKALGEPGCARLLRRLAS